MHSVLGLLSSFHSDTAGPSWLSIALLIHEGATVLVMVNAWRQLRLVDAKHVASWSSSV